MGCDKNSLNFREIKAKSPGFHNKSYFFKLTEKDTC